MIFGRRPRTTPSIPFNFTTFWDAQSTQDHCQTLMYTRDTPRDRRTKLPTNTSLNRASGAPALLAAASDTHKLHVLVRSASSRCPSPPGSWPETKDSWRTVLRRMKQHTVSVCRQAARVRAAAAHRVPRRCPATSGPPSEALKDRGPAKQRGPQRWRCTEFRPDTPAGQNLRTMTVGKGTSRRCKAQDRGIRAHTSYLYQSRPKTLEKGARWTC